MTRLFAWIGISYLSALTACVAFGGVAAGILGILFLIGFGVSVVVRRLRQTGILPVVFLVIGVAFGVFYGNELHLETKLSALDGQTVLVTGKVCELPAHQYQRFSYLLDVTQIQTQQGEIIEGVGKIRVSVQNALDIDLYDTLEGMVGVSRPSDGGFSSRSSYLSKGISLTGFLYEYEDYAIEPADSYPLYYYALRMREGMLDSLRTMLPPEQAEVLAGAILGQTEALDEEVKEDFRTVGISHILAVSGMHLAMVSQIFLRLMHVCRVPKRMGIALSMAGILCFMALTGFPASVLRSGLMLLLYLGGKLIRRNVHPLNSLGFAVFCLCIANPYAAADLGLLLSFSATLGLQMFPPAARRFFVRRWGRPFLFPLLHSKRWFCRLLPRAIWSVWRSLSVTAGAALFTLPITVLAFGQVSLLAPVANLLLAVPCALLVQTGFIAGVLHLIPAFSLVSEPLAFAAGVLTKIVCWAAHHLAKIPFASVPASFGFVGIWLSASLFLLGLVLVLFHRRKLPLSMVSAFSVILLLLGVLSHQEFYQPVIRVAVLDIGEGACVVLSQNHRAAVLGCDGYSSAPVLRYLKSQGITQIDLVQFTDHSDEEMEHAVQILKTYPTTQVLLRQGEYVDGTLRASLATVEQVDYYNKQSEIFFWGRVWVRIAGTYEKDGMWFSVDGLDFLLAPQTLEIVQENSRKADVAILEGIPENGSWLQPFFTVLSMEQIEEPVFKQDWPTSQSTYATLGQGHLVFDCVGREITIRREP